MGGYDRPLRRRRGRRRRAEGQAGGRAAGGWQPQPGPVAARPRPRRRDHPAHLPRGRRPGQAAVPRHRPGPGARAGRVARRRQRGDDAGLPYGRAPAVRVGHARHDARDIDTPSRGPDDRRPDRLRLVVFPQILGEPGREPIFAGLPDVNLELLGTDPPSTAASSRQSTALRTPTRRLSRGAKAQPLVGMYHCPVHGASPQLWTGLGRDYGAPSYYSPNFLEGLFSEVRLTACADRSWLAGGSALPAVTTPGFSDEPAYDDDHV